ncbi:M20 family metallopeptidase [Dethiosulfovibrio acidaminovorans]|uniref:M20 family metallopeptidase n=2 Tax=Dethiosulfovibrio TaxID=47054 RepID=A0ABS9ESP1_9BACT|nr:MULTISPECIES: M20 family metallopeptidase [Dethiosulfovibrio]MCF4115212.1 M20 family metallopeptidase [Dethiosulfovibrio russensis]MCF4143679.1 M20 family metallopeptidase [Dethiosulfovibrio marinus]MCF4146176.1 M20 family metallopeptidase [Dethiosulfovibrio acidaminovorans]
MKRHELVPDKEIVQILQNLVRIRTTLPRGDERDCANYIASLFSKDRVKIKLLEHGGNRASLKISIPGDSEEKNLAFVGHMDTIDVDDPDSWTRSPFGAEHEDGKIYGKGTINAKGGLASIIAAGLAMVRSGINPPYPVHLCLSADEELNGIGAGALLKSGLMDEMDELVVVEPTSMSIALAEKGALWLEISVEGKECHSATPEKGVNAVTNFMKLASNLNQTLLKEPSHRLLGRNSCTVTKIEGGSNLNVVPGKARGVLDIRLLPSIDSEDIAKKAREIADEMESQTDSLKIEMREVNSQPPVGMHHSAPIVVNFKNICNSLNIPSEEIGIHPFTDASRLVPILGIPFVIFGPGDHNRSYTVDEWISVEEVCTAAEVFLRYAMGNDGKS